MDTSGADLQRAYTPSFNLLGHESLIMQQSDIGIISDASYATYLLTHWGRDRATGNK